ncbi:MAG: PRC-barrel domain-containing protein [Acidobacteria bacterium]|nr:PRC-barrel domain-containing protein [Acidobacteriota bacterium]
MIGRAVVAREGGQEIGKVKDLVVDPSGARVLGLVVSEGFLKSTKVAPWMGVQAIGPDSVILTAVTSVVKAGEAPDIKAVLEKELNIRGLRLQTTAGKDLGKIEDLQFEETTGAVLGYELSGEAAGRNWFLPTPPSMELGKDLAFVAPEAEATIEKT